MFLKTTKESSSASLHPAELTQVYEVQSYSVYKCSGKCSMLISFCRMSSGDGGTWVADGVFEMCIRDV